MKRFRFQVETIPAFILFSICFIVSIAQLSCSVHEGGETMGTISLRSTAFENGGMIPSLYTCDGKNISPPLEWSQIPGGTVTLALINDDPDAPVGDWVHWVLFNVPPTTAALAPGVEPMATLADASVQGTNDFKRLGYGGPCPPSGSHRYFFKLYALDINLNLKPGATKREVEQAMKGHILGQGQLMGKYSRAR